MHFGNARRMELRHLRYFVAVAEGENASLAAGKLGVSQPALSRQVHDLEEELGVLLFTRTGRSLSLTPAGRVFLNEARAVLARADEAVQKVRSSPAVQAEINVGYLPSGTVGILLHAIRSFRVQFPSVRVVPHDLSPEEMQPLLLQKKLDVALTVLRQKLSPALEMQKLASSETCIAVGRSHPLAGAKFVSLEQMASEPVATYSRKDFPGYNKHLEKMFATVGRQPTLGSEHDSGSSLIAAVAAGQGFALLPRSVRSASGTRLKFLKLRPALPPWDFVAIWRKDSANHGAIRAFLAAAT
jgi:DNA-binding transcriptional LysR family regulator